MFNLRMDPYERADVTSNTYYDWLIDHAFLMSPRRIRVPVPDDVQGLSATQQAASFNMDEVLAKLKESSGSK